MTNKILCFLIPYFNHPYKIAELIELLSTYDYPILIVDDGSDFQSKKALKTLSSSQVHIITRPCNGGKGAAVRSGFEYAYKMGFWSCFQIDADMQHDLTKIPLFLREWKKNPDSIICANPQYGQDVPKSRLYGRKITRFWVWVNTWGGELKDTMCGMRIYPIAKMKNIIQKIHSNRMDFDIDILMHAYREDLQFIWIDVDVVYDKNNMSHFSALKDNLRIAKIHAKHFFCIPLVLVQRYKKKYKQKNEKQKNWWQKQERGGRFYLRITLTCVLHLPYPLLRILVGMITCFYFFISKKERENLAIFHSHLKKAFPNTNFNSLRPYDHFYAFGECICDKFAVWCKKIEYKDLDFSNEAQKDRAFNDGIGKVIIVSHFGNAEIARAMDRREGQKPRMNILLHSKNAKEFSEVINQISGVELGIFEVESLGVKEMLELKACVDRGESIGIMGDRISFNANQSKNIEVNFLGQKCLFPSGAFIIAGILQCPVGMLWCEKRHGRYLISYEELADSIPLGKNKEQSIRPFLQHYVTSLEERVRNNPTQWFNFFNIWEQGR